MNRIILVLYQWDLSFFAFSPKNIKNIRQTIFYLIDWGFSYEALVQMPIEEFLDYSNLLYKHKRDRGDAEEEVLNESSAGQKKPDGKSIGQVIPRQ